MAVAVSKSTKVGRGEGFRLPGRRKVENPFVRPQTGVQVVVDQQVRTPWRVSGSVNVFRNEIDAFETVLPFPRRRPFGLDASTVGTWDATLPVSDAPDRAT
jgi:hypothetical protein